jgi:Glycosyl transferase family 2
MLVTIYYNKTCFGLGVDARILEKLLKGNGCQVKMLDMNEPAVAADCAFHLETPVYQVMGYSHVNVLMINAEQWISDVYDPYLAAFDQVFVRCQDDCQRFVAAGVVDAAKIRAIPWSIGGATGMTEKEWGAGAVIGDSITDDIGFVCFIGKNEYKYEWLRDFLAAGGWAADFPGLRVYTSQAEYAEGLAAAAAAPNIKIECRDLDAAQISRLQWLYKGHLLCSRGEGFGYAAAEAEARGATLLLSDLPVFREYYGDSPHVAWLPTRGISKDDTAAPKARRGLRYELKGVAENTVDGTRIALTNIMAQNGVVDRRKVGWEAMQARWQSCQEAFAGLWQNCVELWKARKPVGGNWHAPPVLMPADCPPMTIVTPTRNRRALIDIAFHNLLSTDYPLEKITWIVVENSDDPAKGVSDKIMNFQLNCRKIKIKYIPLPDGVRRTVGEMRNIGVEHAEDDIVVFMDDDDHYPVTSFRRRVAWLQRGIAGGIAGRRARIVGCTTLALYDLKKGVSAVNVPPWDLRLGQRISEATLAFHRSAWLDRKFGDVGVAEGEGWIDGREVEFLEIPPQQVIVAFSHGDNSTSRRVPDLGEPNGCFWGFPPQYLKFIHGLVGIAVEDSGAGGRHGKAKKGH